MVCVHTAQHACGGLRTTRGSQFSPRGSANQNQAARSVHQVPSPAESSRGPPIGFILMEGILRFTTPTFVGRRVQARCCKCSFCSASSRTLGFPLCSEGALDRLVDLLIYLCIYFEESQGLAMQTRLSKTQDSPVSASGCQHYRCMLPRPALVF